MVISIFIFLWYNDCEYVGGCSMNILLFLTPKDSTSFLEYDCTIRQALEKMDYHKFSVIPLVDENGAFITTISEGDILRHIKNKGNFSLEDAQEDRLCDIPRYRPYEALDVNCNLEDVIDMSLNQNFIPLIDDRGMYIGIVKRKDVIQYFYNLKKNGMQK